MIHQVTNSYGNYSYNAFIYEDITWESHFHGNYELIYMIEGSYNVTINNTTVKLNQGELLLIPPFSVHSLDIHNCKAWVAVFSKDHISAFDRENRYSHFSKFKCSKEIEGFLKSNLFMEEKPEHYLCISCLYLVCNECKKNATLYSDYQEQRLMDEVLKYIEKNYLNEISMQEISSALNYEYHYFSALFNKTFSMNFKRFLNLFRYEKACEMILEDAFPLSVIAMQCGFGSIRNFNRVFKELSGYTPKEFKKLKT